MECCGHEKITLNEIALIDPRTQRGITVFGILHDLHTIRVIKLYQLELYHFHPYKNYFT